MAATTCNGPNSCKCQSTYGNDCKLHNLKYTIGSICTVLLLPVNPLEEESTGNRTQLRQGELEQKERGEATALQRRMQPRGHPRGSASSSGQRGSAAELPRQGGPQKKREVWPPRLLSGQVLSIWPPRASFCISTKWQRASTCAQDKAYTSSAHSSPMMCTAVRVREMCSVCLE